MASSPCFKCNGSGQVAFKHVADGVCFQCKGTGSLSFRKRAPAFVEAHPEHVVPAAERATDAQWDYMGKLCGDHDDTFCRIVETAGAFMASQRYVSRKVMSAAIEAAKADPIAAKWRRDNRTMRRAG